MTLAARAKSLKSATLAIALATAFVPGIMTAAEAKGGHGHGHHGHHGFHRIGFYGPTYVTYGYGGCGWLKARAVSTGSRYWWNRYQACRGD